MSQQNLIEEEAEETTTRRWDPELRAINLCIKALDEVTDDNAKMRAVYYLFARFGKTELTRSRAAAGFCLQCNEPQHLGQCHK